MFTRSLLKQQQENDISLRFAIKVFGLWCMCRRVVPSPDLIVEYTDLKQREGPRYAVRLSLLNPHALNDPSTIAL
jgi:hypothetical protein